MKSPRPSPRLVPILLVGVVLLVACQRNAEAPPQPATPAKAAPVVAADEAVAVDTVGFQGFGPAHFGDGEEAVRKAWGRPLSAAGSEPAECLQLFPDPRPDKGFGTSFMLVHGRFVRYDVDSDLYPAPGGVRVGSRSDEVLQRYSGRVQQVPHKYVEGAQYLIVSTVEGGPTRLIFEVAPDGVVSRWRIGLPPAVDYVEGCS